MNFAYDDRDGGARLKGQRNSLQEHSYSYCS